MGYTLTASGQQREQGPPSPLAKRTETALQLAIGRGYRGGDSLPGAPRSLERRARTPPVR